MSQNNSEFQLPIYNTLDIQSEISAAYETPARHLVAVTPENTETIRDSARYYEIHSDIERVRKSVDDKTFFANVDITDQGMFARLMHAVGFDSRPALKDFTVGDLVNMESEIGAEIMGEPLPGETHMFFYEKEHSWFYVRQFKDANKKDVEIATRFEVHPDQIVVSIDGTYHRPIGPQDARRFMLATTEYHKRVMNEIYQQPSLGQRKHAA